MTPKRFTIAELAEIEAAPKPIPEETVTALRMQLLVNLEESSNLLIGEGFRIRQKPLLGGVFGMGGFALASFWAVSGGLDRVVYFVIQQSSWLIIGCGDSKAQAIGTARELIELIPARVFARFIGELGERRKKAAAEARAKADREREEWRAATRVVSKVRSIPRRRQQIFDAAEGKCHYCQTQLTLDGKWHIEHKMPKALMGGNEPSNLVASCVSCNQQKRDLTDVEFNAKRAAT